MAACCASVSVEDVSVQTIAQDAADPAPVTLTIPVPVPDALVAIVQPSRVLLGRLDRVHGLRVRGALLDQHAHIDRRATFSSRC